MVCRILRVASGQNFSNTSPGSALRWRKTPRRIAWASASQACLTIVSMARERQLQDLLRWCPRNVMSNMRRHAIMPASKVKRGSGVRHWQASGAVSCMHDIDCVKMRAGGFSHTTTLLGHLEAHGQILTNSVRMPLTSLHKTFQNFKQTLLHF